MRYSSYFLLFIHFTRCDTAEKKYFSISILTLRYAHIFPSDILRLEIVTDTAKTRCAWQNLSCRHQQVSLKEKLKLNPNKQHLIMCELPVHQLKKSIKVLPNIQRTILSLKDRQKKRKKKRMKFLSSGILAIFIFHYPKSIKLSQLHFQQLWANYSAAPQQFSPRLNNSYWIRYFYCSLTRNQIH